MEGNIPHPRGYPGGGRGNEWMRTLSHPHHTISIRVICMHIESTWGRVSRALKGDRNLSS